jgi:predicted P-loop ATPase
MLYREWTQASRAAVGHLPRPWEVLDTEIALFEGEQEARYEGDVYETMIRKHVELHTGKVTMQDILDTCLKLEISKWTPAEQRRVGKAMKVLGWERKRETTGSREWYYVRPEEKLVVSIRPSIAQSGVDDESPL